MQTWVDIGRLRLLFTAPSYGKFDTEPNENARNTTYGEEKDQFENAEPADHWVLLERLFEAYGRVGEDLRLSFESFFLIVINIGHHDCVSQVFGVVLAFEDHLIFVLDGEHLVVAKPFMGTVALFL